MKICSHKISHSNENGKKSIPENKLFCCRGSKMYVVISKKTDSVMLFLLLEVVSPERVVVYGTWICQTF